MKPIRLEEKIAVCQEYTQLWASYFNFFGDGFEGRKVTGEAEAQFFRIMTDLARKQFRLVHYIGDDLKNPEAILSILYTSVSLSNLQGMNEAQFSKFQHEWHIVFIALNKCLGRLMEKIPVPKPGKPAPAAKAPQKPAAS